MNSESSQKVINLLTICRRAGMLVMGHDTVKEKSAEGKIFIILTACDLSEKSKKEVRYFSDMYGVDAEETTLSMVDLQNALGRKTGIVGVIDEGFSKQFKKLIS